MNLLVPKSNSLKWQLIFSRYDQVLFYFLYLLVFIIPYAFGQWWKFIPSSISIFFIAYASHKIRFVDFLGITCSFRQVPILLSFFLIVALCSYFYIRDQSIATHISMVSFDNFVLWHVGIAFQVLNEEIVFRALLLKILMNLTNSKVISAIISSMLFVSLHILIYLVFKNIFLNYLSLCVLFLFSIVCSTAFLTNNHIWFGFVIHYGWNFTRFTHTYFSPNNEKLTEGALFNILEGNSIVIVILLLLLTICIIRSHA